MSVLGYADTLYYFLFTITIHHRSLWSPCTRSRAPKGWSRWRFGVKLPCSQCNPFSLFAEFAVSLFHCSHCNSALQECNSATVLCNSALQECNTATVLCKSVRVQCSKVCPLAKELMGCLHSQHLLHYYQDTAPLLFCIVISYVRSYFPLFAFKSALLVFCIVISSAGAYFTLDRRKNPLCVVRELVLCTEPRYYATRSFPTSTILLPRAVTRFNDFCWICGFPAYNLWH